MSNIIDKIQVSGVTYDIGGSGGGKAIEAGRGIAITTGETADTVSFDLPISAGTGTNALVIASDTYDIGNKAKGEYSVCLNGGGYHPNYAYGTSSLAQGYDTKAYGIACHSEGYGSKAGVQNNINIQYAHAEGDHTEAKGTASHAEGRYTKTNNNSEHASGQYNISNSATTIFGNSGNTLFSVGNGTSNSARHNAFEIRQNADIYISLNGQDVKLQDQLGGGGSSYTAGDGIDITNDVISVTGMVDTSTYNTYTAATDTALASKQTTLTASTGISIVDNVISATGGGMTEDDELLLSTALVDLNERKIDVSEVKSNYQKKGDYVTTSTLNTRLAEYETALDEQNVEEVTAYALNDLNDRFGGLKIVKISETEYAALTAKDENTLYIVVADPS